MTKYKIQLKDAEGNLYYPNTLNGEGLPIGSMIPYSNKVIPNGFLPCDGSEVSRTEYKDLFAVIGITYGEGDGETTFNLPDKRGRVSVGLDETQNEFNSIGLKDGESEVTLTVDEMPKHNHKHREWVFNGASASGAHYGFGYQTNTGGAYDRDEYGNSGEVQFGNYPTGGDKAHNNLQPYEVDQWIIKAFNGGYSQPVSGDVNDTLPVGSIIEFDGDYIPDGYEEVENYEPTYSTEEYSTEEKRIGTWLGKPLYRKTLFYASSEGNQKFVPNHNIENFEGIVNAYGKFTRVSTGIQCLIPMNYTSWESWIYDFTATNYVLRWSDAQWNAGVKDIYVTLEYTKTTD